MPEHVIPSAEVDDWLADSVVKKVTYHRTTWSAATDIVEYGIDLDRSEIGAFGQGFYTATEPESWRGPAQVSVAIKMSNPLVGSIDDVSDVIDPIVPRLRPRARGITPDVAAAIRQELLAMGYDGIIVRDGGGDGIDYVIAIRDGTARVVRES